MGKHNVRHKNMHQKKQIGIKDNRAGCLGVPVLGAGGVGRVRWTHLWGSRASSKKIGCPCLLLV